MAKPLSCDTTDRFSVEYGIYGRLQQDTEMVVHAYMLIRFGTLAFSSSLIPIRQVRREREWVMDKG